MTRRNFAFGSMALALQQGKLGEAVRLIQAQIADGRVSAASLYVRQGSSITRKAFGKAATPDAPFLLASITKPMTVTAVMQQVEQGKVKLTDPVQTYIPEFTGAGREKVLVRHLLTHTSGLPDMLPDNTELRNRHAPLPDFVAGTCRTPLLFEPGTKVSYQSMGILLAATIVERIAKQPLPAYLQQHVFKPLDMAHASLGLGGRRLESTVQIQVPEQNDYDWNSAYWRNLASPWGGTVASAGDVALFLQSFARPTGRILKPETAKQMITDQTNGLRQRWGFGWRLGPEPHAAGCSPSTFGHSGSTGTLCWHDPARDLTFVLLTSLPADKSSKTLLQPVSNAVSAAA